MRGCQAPFGTPLAVSKVEEDRGDDEEYSLHDDEDLEDLLDSDDKDDGVLAFRRGLGIG